MTTVQEVGFNPIELAYDIQQLKKEQGSGLGRILEEEIHHKLFLERYALVCELMKYQDFQLPHTEPDNNTTQENTVPVIVKSNPFTNSHYLTIPGGFHPFFPKGLRMYGKEDLAVPIIERDPRRRQMDVLTFPLPYDIDSLLDYLKDSKGDRQVAEGVVLRYTAAKMTYAAYATYHKQGFDVSPDKSPGKTHLLFFRPAKRR